MQDKTVNIEGHKFTVFSKDIEGSTLFGWHIEGQGCDDSGCMYNGRPYSVPRTKYQSFEQAVDDLADHLRYYHGISRADTQEAFK